MNKRFGSLLLASTMCVSLLCVPAFAADDDTLQDGTYDIQVVNSDGKTMDLLPATVTDGQLSFDGQDKYDETTGWSVVVYDENHNPVSTVPLGKTTDTPDPATDDKKDDTEDNNTGDNNTDNNGNTGSGTYTPVIPSNNNNTNNTTNNTPATDDKKDDDQKTDEGEKTPEEQQPTVTHASDTFSDLQAGAWYEDAVDYVVAHSLMQGSDGKFSPYANLSRAMLAQILYNNAGKPAAEGGSFTDVPAGQWYTNAVNWASAQGIVEGIGGGKFGPNDNITRESLAVMLWRAAGKPTPTQQTLNAPDADKVDSWALQAMLWANENGILTGDENQRLNPTGQASRVEAAKMIMTYLELGK
jgi:hypothetical protein